MKFAIVIIAILAFLCRTEAQSYPAVPDTRPLESVIRDFEMIYGVRFIYNDSVKGLICSRSYNSVLSGSDMNKDLQHLFFGTGICWKVFIDLKSIALTTGETDMDSPSKNRCMICGYVRDKTTNEALAGAGVVTADGNGTVTDDHGFFALSSKSRIENISCSFIGYKTMRIIINPGKEKVMDICLTPDMSISASQVISHKRTFHEDTYADAIEIPENVLKNTPGDYFGEDHPGISAITTHFD